MTYILNIETATKNCSVSLTKNGQTIALREIAEQGYSHAEKLHVFIEEIIREAGILFNDLSAVAVSQGPGSYTGLRIGIIKPFSILILLAKLVKVSIEISGIFKA